MPLDLKYIIWICYMSLNYTKDMLNDLKYVVKNVRLKNFDEFTVNENLKDEV